jgi:hypothetical protein
VELSFFALELCMRLESRGHLRETLYQLVSSHPAVSPTAEKSRLLHRLSELLAENEELWERGCWEFFDDDGRARRDYESWVRGMTNEETARSSESGYPEKYGEARYMTFTVSMLLVQGTPAERALARVCDTREDQLWRKETFRRIVHGLRDVDYSAVKSDTLYLIPGDITWGLTLQDLGQSKFDYLRKIV